MQIYQIRWRGELFKLLSEIVDVSFSSK